MSRMSVRLSALALSLIVVTTSRGDEQEDRPGGPLPPGAKARLGTIRGGPLVTPGQYSTAYLMPDGKSLLVPGEFGPVFHDMATGQPRDLFGFGHWAADLTTLAVSDDGKRAVSSRGGNYLVWDVKSGDVIRAVKSSRIVQSSSTAPGNRRSSPVSLSWDGKVLAFAEGPAGVVVWDVEKHEQLARISALQNEAVYLLLSPDGKRLATHGSHRPIGGQYKTDNEVRPDTVLQLWHAATGKLERTMPGVFVTEHSRTAIVFSPDGTTLATCSAGHGINPIRLWDIETGKEKDPILCRLEHGVKLAFSPDGRTLAAVAEDGAIDRWSLPEGKPLKSTPFSRRDSIRYRYPDLHVVGLKFLDNERVIAWGAVYGRILVWDAPGGKLLTEDQGHIAPVRCVEFASQDREIVTASDDYRILRWDATGKVVGQRTLRQNPYRQLHQFGSRGSHALTWGLVIDLTTGEELFSLPFLRPFRATGCARVAGFVGSRHPAELPACEVWDMETRRKIGRFELPANAELSGGVPDSVAALSPDGRRLVTAVRVRASRADVPIVFTGWDVKTGKKLGEFTEPNNAQVFALAAANNTSCAVTTADGKLWEVNFERGIRGKVIDTSPPKTGQFTVPTFSPGGKRLAVGVPTGKREWTVRVYDWPEGHLLHSFTGHTGTITALAFSSNGTTLASGSADGTVILWDLRLLRGH